MTAKEYLQQVHKMDRQIDSKIEMLTELNALATKCTAILTGMPHNPSGSKSQMADTVDKIVDLQDEINADISRMVEVKAEVIRVIGCVQDINCRILLEKRYLSYKTWEQIANDMNFGLRYVHILHKKALAAVAPFVEKEGA